jgi:hypothetical protein
VACTIDSCSGACINTPDDSACDDGNACTSDSCSATGCVFTPIPGCTGQVCPTNPSPKNVSYWRNQCKGHGGGADAITEADVACVASQGDIFASFDEVKDICDVVSGSLAGVCSKASASLVSLALNICHAKVCDATVIDSRFSDNTTVGESYDEADALLSTPSGTSCTLAKNLADEINKGQAVNLSGLESTEPLTDEPLSDVRSDRVRLSDR